MDMFNIEVRPRKVHLDRAARLAGPAGAARRQLRSVHAPSG